ncbi:MAG TPA: hypothetical protein VGU46_08760 [Acidobacteriaceae bacterium]|nr:hypothetical protein [Acidobacteriaceae bacterium]
MADVTTKVDEAAQSDEAQAKGAVEGDGRERVQGESLAGQLGHRDQSELLKDNDTDFPEPDAKGEHSGE